MVFERVVLLTDWNGRRTPYLRYLTEQSQCGAHAFRFGGSAWRGIAKSAGGALLAVEISRPLEPDAVYAAVGKRPYLSRCRIKARPLQDGPFILGKGDSYAATN